MATRRWDSLGYAAAVVLPRLPAFLFLPAIANALSVGDMGLLASSWVFLELFQTLAGMGLKAALGRFFPLAEGAARNTVLTASLYGIAAGGAALGLCAAGLRAWPAAGAALPFLGALGDDAFAALLASAFLGNLASALLIYLRAEQKAIAFLSVSAIGAAVEACFLAVLWATHRFTLAHLLGLEAVKQGVILLCIAVPARKDLAPNASFPELRRQLAFGLWFVPIGLGEWFITGSDRFWLGKLGGLADVGVYGFLYRFAMPLSVLFAGGLLDAHARLYKFAGQEGEGLAEGLLTRYLMRSGAIVAAYALLFPAALWLAGRKAGLFPPAYLSGLPAAPLMAAVLFALYWGKYYGTILEYRMRARALMAAQLGVAAASALLIPAGILIFSARGGNVLCGSALGALAAETLGIIALGRLAGTRGGLRAMVAGAATLAVCLAAAAAWAMSA